MNPYFTFSKQRSSVVKAFSTKLRLFHLHISNGNIKVERGHMMVQLTVRINDLSISNGTKPFYSTRRESYCTILGNVVIFVSNLGCYTPSTSLLWCSWLLKFSLPEKIGVIRGNLMETNYNWQYQTASWRPHLARRDCVLLSSCQIYTVCWLLNRSSWMLCLCSITLK